MVKFKFGVCIYSKYTGESIFLGSQYDTYEDAKEGAEKQVCPRCNRIEIINIPKNSIWVDKNTGFASLESQKNKLEQKQEMELHYIKRKVKELNGKS